MERTTYATTGITTVREVRTLLIALVLVGLGVVVFHAIRTHDIAASVMAGFWIVCVAIGNIRIIRELASLDPTERGTQVAVQQAAHAPILGIIPVIFLLF